MLPEFLPHYSIGPFIGLITNLIMTILCLMVMAIYRHYRPLRALLSFYVLSVSLFLGWLIYGLQKSPQSILLGYRIDLASLSLLPVSWAWFISSLEGKRFGLLFRVMVGFSIFLAILALFAHGSLFMGLPLESHMVDPDILRPHSKILKPTIYFYCFFSGLFFSFTTIKKLFWNKGYGKIHFLPMGLGLLFWFLGGIHDGLRSLGVVLIFKTQILWFTSFWLSVLITVSVAIHFRSLEKAIREARDVFEKFVPPSYLRRIATKGLGSITLGEADREVVTILCCDIRGFTSLSENLDPGRLVGLVNQLYERILKVIEARMGVVDKFLGDAILCIFEGEDSARRSVECGVDILREVKFFNSDKEHSFGYPIQIGIGLHRGPVILGTIGSFKRMDSTVLGLTVNLAKRLEELTRILGVEMLISDGVANLLPYGHTHRLRILGDALVRGSIKPITLFEVYDQDVIEMRNLKDRIGPIVNEGIEIFKRGLIHEALLKIEEAQRISPQDIPTQFLIKAIKNRIRDGNVDSKSIILDFR